MSRIKIPKDSDKATLLVDGHRVVVTNLGKLFWPEEGITKGDLLQYYVEVAPYLLPHIKDRPMVLKRYPNGAEKDFFFMKRAPEPRPRWIRTCRVRHKSGNIIDFVLVQDLPALL